MAAQPFSIADQQAWLRTRLAAERTLMSWNRTALKLIAFGLTIYKAFQKIQEALPGQDLGRPEAARNLGLSLIVAGTLGTVIALWQYLQVKRYLAGPEFSAIAARERQPRWGLTFGVLAFSAAIGVVTIVWILTGD